MIEIIIVPTEGHYPLKDGFEVMGVTQMAELF